MLATRVDGRRYVALPLALAVDKFESHFLRDSSPAVRRAFFVLTCLQVARHGGDNARRSKILGARRDDLDRLGSQRHEYR